MALELFRDDDGALRGYGGPEDQPLRRFLEGDVQEDITSIQEILRALERIEGGDPAPWQSTGNAHTLTLRRGEVEIQSEMEEDAPPYTTTPEALRRALLIWQAMVESASAAPFAVSSPDENRD